MTGKWWCSFLASLLLMMISLQTHAELAVIRPFPPAAKRGVLDMSSYPTSIAVDGKSRRFSAAIRIYNRDNLIVMAGTLNDSKIIVKYQDNMNGDIDRVWILTTAEIAASNDSAQPPVLIPAPIPMPAPAPSSNPVVK